jgi:hypothetical protein
MAILQQFLELDNWLSCVAHLFDLTSFDDYIQKGLKGKIHQNK